MNSVRDDYQDWMNVYLEPRHPEMMRPFQRALAAFDRIQENRRASPRNLRPILEIARSSNRLICENGAVLLGDLAAEYDEAREALEQLSIDARAGLRINAIIALGNRAPRDLGLSIILRSLKDRSARVRAIAADYAARLYLPEAIPTLERALSVEKNHKARTVIDFSLQRLREGASDQ